MQQVLALLAEIKGFFTGTSAKLDKITSAEERVKALEAELATEKTKGAEKDTKIQALTNDLQTAQEQVNAKGTEIKDLQAKLVTANNKANETIAAQGLDPALIPAAETSTATGTKGETAWAKYNRLRSEDSRAAGAFYAANAEAIFASRPKS